MFDFLFGWRKASKCKKLVKRVQCRLKLLRNKRSTIAGLVRDDVTQLILAGHQDIALNRTEQLCDDLSLISAYELLDQFCEFILAHLSYIRKHKDIPNDINEAISSLIFASARCGDIPELQRIRKLFAERYGQRFTTAAVELFHGNLVNHQIKEKLSPKAVHDDEKQTLFDEIARGCSDPLAIEFASEMQEQIMKEKLSVKPSPDDVEDILVLEFASELQKQRQEKESSKKQILDNYLLTYHNEDKGCQIQESRSVDSLSVGNKCSSRSCQPSRQNSDMTTTSVSSSILRQSSYNFASGEEGEIENVLTVTGRTYATNSASSESSYHCHDETLIYLDDIEEFESPKAKDQDQRLFMFKPSTKGTHNENVKSRRTRKSKKELESWKCRQNSSNECSLEHPCYYCTGDEKDVWEVPMGKQKRGHQHDDDHVVAAVYDAFTYPDTRGKLGDIVARKEMVAPPYRRAATMPQERPKDSLGGIMERWNSCPYKQPSHVHPKLPDYDDIAAKFRALKEDRHQIKLSDT